MEMIRRYYISPLSKVALFLAVFPSNCSFCSGFSSLDPKVAQARQHIKDILSNDNEKSGSNSCIELNDTTLGVRINDLLSICDEFSDCNNTQETSFFYSFDPRAVTGTWRVVHAPHLSFLANFALSKFRPIEYKLSEDGKISAFVYYKSFIGDFRGWLCTSGWYNAEEAARPKVRMNQNNLEVVRIVWDKCWWNIGDRPRPTDPRDGNFADIIQYLGMIGFIKPLSFFPIRYIDDDLVVFTFFGLQITATKILE